MYIKICVEMKLLGPGKAKLAVNSKKFSEGFILAKPGYGEFVLILTSTEIANSLCRLLM